VRNGDPEGEARRGRLPSGSQGYAAVKARRCPQCTRLDPGAALRPQTAQSFDCLDAARPSRIHSSACLRNISRAKGSSARSAAWRQSLAWCSHNSTCDDIGPASCAHLMPARAQVGAVPAGVDRCYQCLFVTRSDECVQVTSLNLRHRRGRSGTNVLEPYKPSDAEDCAHGASGECPAQHRRITISPPRAIRDGCLVGFTAAQPVSPDQRNRQVHQEQNPSDFAREYDPD
jgi:hypothetical protein